MASAALSVLLLLASVPALAGIEVSQRFPTRGSAVTLMVTDGAGRPVAGAEVEVTYRPNSEVSKTESIGQTGAGGHVTWTPTAAGIATLSASKSEIVGEEMSATRNVSVRYESVPVTGVLILLFAGIVLLGGSARNFLGVLRGP